MRNYFVSPENNVTKSENRRIETFRWSSQKFERETSIRTLKMIRSWQKTSILTVTHFFVDPRFERTVNVEKVRLEEKATMNFRLKKNFFLRRFWSPCNENLISAFDNRHQTFYRFQIVPTNSPSEISKIQFDCCWKKKKTNFWKKIVQIGENLLDMN